MKFFARALLLSWVLSLPVLAAENIAESADLKPVQSLSLQACIEQALKANLGLKIERLSPELSQLDLDKQWAQYGLKAGAEAGVNQNLSPSNTSFIEGASVLNQVRQNYSLFLDQNLASGGNIRLDFDNSVVNTNSTRADLNPAFTPRLALNLSHPLLRNSLNGWREIRQRENSLLAADWNLKNQAISTVADVQDAYWNLVLFRERLTVQEKSLGILENLLAMNQEKEKAGFMSRIDVLQTEARIASRRASLLDARRNVENTEDRLKQLLNPESKEEFISWSSAIEPVDRPLFQPYAASVDTSYPRALAQRPDYQALLLDLENKGVQVEVATQNRLPDLRLQGNSGLESLEGDYPNALGKLFSLQTYFWSLGLSFEIPVIGNSLEVTYQQTLVQAEQVRLRRDQLRQQMLREVRQAVRNVDMASQQVEATRLAKDLADEQLKAQTEKLNLGMTTNFQVLQFQSEFESASLAEVNAVVAYTQAINQLQRSEGSLLEILNVRWKQAP